MSKSFNYVYIVLSFVLFILIVFNKRAYNKHELLNNQVVSLFKDSLEKSYVFDDYKQRLLELNYKFSYANLKQVEFYEVFENSKKIQATIDNGKEKFVVRYSTLGCNTCVNLIFKDDVRLSALKEKFDLVVLVDFDRYEDYRKISRVSEIENEVLLVKNGDVFFDSAFGSDSYSFILDKDFNAHSFFVPNNLFPEYLDSYLDLIKHREM